jgi:hypothetical protein
MEKIKCAEEYAKPVKVNGGEIKPVAVYYDCALRTDRPKLQSGNEICMKDRNGVERERLESNFRLPDKNKPVYRNKIINQHNINY